MLIVNQAFSFSAFRPGLARAEELDSPGLCLWPAISCPPRAHGPTGFPFSPIPLEYAPDRCRRALWSCSVHHGPGAPVAGAISPPCAANNTWCTQLTTVVIPRCERMRGDPGCWCGNHDPVHYCAICMSNPTDNQTTPDQTASATAGHSDFHVACNAYEALINGTATTTSSSSSSSTTPTASASAAPANQGGDKVPIAPIIGGVVGGVVGLVLIGGLIWVTSLWIKEKNRNNSNQDIAPSSVSYMGSEHKSPMGYAAPYPHTSMNHYSSPGHISPLPNVGYTNNAEPMNPGAPMGPGPQQNV
ncbi:hypothetical protein RhiJN_10607 [Ceratobasidium sp. AG-Ba]|nr:hypothetical protein RhiJN_10607 [Ceratobasidium sp. AG-Ba]QRW11344.1 hypothetical protein RhiLY_10343 [Ceratobasidium sp. AG-Ba]